MITADVLERVLRKVCVAMTIISHPLPPIPQGQVRVYLRDLPGKGWVWIADEYPEDALERRQIYPKLEYQFRDQTGCVLTLE